MCRNRELLKEIQCELRVQSVLLREIAKTVTKPAHEADVTALTQALQDLESLAPQQEKEKEEKK